MPKLLIIADDLTGVLDVAVQLEKQGIRTSISFFPGEVAFDVEVNVVCTESRHISSEEAYRRVFQVASSAIKKGVEYIYKKTDSTMRGNIGSELQAIMDAANQERLLFIPAFPKNNRTTRFGQQLVDGIDISKSVFKFDIANRIDESDILKIISIQTDVPVYSVPVDCHETQINTGGGIYVFDAETDEDLIRIARHIKKYKDISLFAGCAGFAEYLPIIVDLKKQCESSNSTMFQSAIPGKMLVMCGSANPVSYKQIKCLEKKGMDIHEVSADINRETVEDVILSITNDIDRTGISVICTEEYGPEKSNIKEDWKPEAVERVISEIAEKALKKADIGFIFVIGGDTLMAILKRFKCDRLVPISEIESGVVVSRVYTEEGKELTVISKSGGFGGEDVIYNTCEKLKQIHKNI